MDEAADLAVDRAGVTIDNKDGLFGRTNQIRSEDTGAGDGSVGRPPFG